MDIECVCVRLSYTEIKGETSDPLFVCLLLNPSYTFFKNCFFFVLCCHTFSVLPLQLVPKTQCFLFILLFYFQTEIWQQNAIITRCEFQQLPLHQFEISTSSYSSSCAHTWTLLIWKKIIFMCVRKCLLKNNHHYHFNLCVYIIFQFFMVTNGPEILINVCFNEFLNNLKIERTVLINEFKERLEKVVETNFYKMIFMR